MLAVVAISVLVFLVLGFTWLSVNQLGTKSGLKYVADNIFTTAILRPTGMVLASFAPVDKTLVPSIKPLPGRTQVDRWKWKWMNRWFGNPEDGVTGKYAVGPSWFGYYNPTGGWAGRMKWNWRNNAAGFNYEIWPKAPVVKKNYKVLWMTRELQLGWTALPTSDGWVVPEGQVRMVCSF